MAIQNPRFEKEGQYPGEAEEWTLRTLSSLWGFAGFGDKPEVAWERIDRCCEYFGSLEASGFVLAFFDNKAEGYEDFEEGWDNNVYLRELPTGHLETLEIETMDYHSYWLTLGDTDKVIAAFGESELEEFILVGFVK